MIRLFNKSNALVLATVAVMAVAWSLPDLAEARRGGGGGHRGGGGGGGGHRGVKGGTRTNVNRGGSRKSVNKNVSKKSVNKNVNINKNVNVNVDRRHGGYYDRRYRPVARTAAVVATAVVVGSIIYSLPSNCTTVVTNNISYRQCGSTWYQPRYSGGSTSYVVVNAP